MAELIKLGDWRQAAGVSRASLARHLGISVQAINDLEGREDSKIRPSTRQRYMDAIEDLAARRRQAQAVTGRAVIQLGREILEGVGVGG
jgi:transcriptional regulator with XRE-family HTH domain